MPVYKIQKRFGGGHAGGAPEKLTLPADGIDPLPPIETWTDEYGQKPVITHPEEYASGLKLKNWYSYHDKPMPKLFPSAEENMRMWQDIHVEKMLDSHPGHEIHPKDLPDYHYWPMIQNDRQAKYTGQVPQLVQHQYHADQTEIPRFHKNGVAKTPPQEQIWYTPLDDNGRCDWRAVMARWAGSQQQPFVFSARNWNDRYTRYAYTENLFAWRNALKILSIHRPILYKHTEMPSEIKFWRLRRGTMLAQPLVLLGVYFAMMGLTGANQGSYKSLAWEDEPWNYDMFYMKYFRDKGAYHPPL